MCTIDEKAAVHSADHAGADAPHTHAHTHEHGHDHGHTHEHHSPEETVALLAYMVTHNQHHAEELHELAHSVEGEAAQLLHEAVVDLTVGNEKLCLSTVWTAERQPVCKNVASVTQKDGQLVFTDIMGIPTVVNGQIEKIDLMENEIIIKKATA